MILIDYSQVAIASLMPFFTDISKDASDLENLGRHAILSKIKSLRSKFRDYGRVVIATDDTNYWRRDIFPHYKAGRAKAKGASDIPWDEIYRVLDIVRNELREFSPYTVIQVPKAEADDIFGVLVLEVANKRLVQVGLEMDNEPTIMLCWDGDMKQLLATPNVRMYSPKDNKYLKLDMKAKEFLRRKILTGDGGDGIPNVFSPADTFVTGTRQKQATEKKMAPLLEAENMADAAEGELKKRIQLNEKLISFTHIPVDVRDQIIEAFDSKPKGTKMTLYQYLGRKRCNLLMDDIDNF